MSQGSTSDAGLTTARAALASTAKLRGTLDPLQGAAYPFGASVAYPQTGDAFPQRLAALAQMMSLGMPLKCVAIEGNGAYDVHDGQARWMPENIDLLSRSLAAFQADLEARGFADRVVVHVWSEFGRRVRENGTGTDHGAAGLSMLMGTSVAGGTLGEYAGLGPAGVDAEDNLRHNVDYRGVYASLTEQWLGVDADGIIARAGDFARYPLIRT